MKPLLTLILMYLAISATQETGVLKHNLDCQQNPETGNCFFSVDAKNSNYENAVKTCKERSRQVRTSQIFYACFYEITCHVPSTP